MSDCIFCKIIANEIPCAKVYEDDKVLAFLDIKPNNPGHTLIIPKEHTESLSTISESSWLEIQGVIRLLAPKIQKAVSAEGYNLEMNNGSVAGQLVNHAHVHIIPRFADDGLIHWPGKEYKNNDMNEVLEKIKKEL